MTEYTREQCEHLASMSNTGDTIRQSPAKPAQGHTPGPDLWQKLDELEAINADLLAACKAMLAYVEMKLAHTGTQNVEQILSELERVRATVSDVTTAHHVGCSKTSRSVNLAAVRAAIAKAEGRAQ